MRIKLARSHLPLPDLQTLAHDEAPREVSKIPYMQFFVDDFEAATAHLTFEEDGIYNRLLRLAWRTPRCSLPHDPVWIARKMRTSALEYQDKIKPILEEFFSLRRGRWSQKKQLKIFRETVSKIGNAKRAGRLGGLSKSLESQAIASSERASEKLANQNQNQSSYIDKSFLEFPEGSIGYSPFAAIARQHGGGWDINKIAEAFRTWTASKSIRPRDLKKVFTTFCKRYAAQRGKA